MKEYKYCALVSFDIQGTFDVINWKVLAETVNTLPIGQYLKSLLKNYITDRTLSFKFVTGIEWFRLSRGLPQGSCIGPLLWLIVADRILKIYKEM